MQTLDLAPMHPYIRTKSDANELVLKLESLGENIFKKDTVLEKILEVELPDNLSRGIEELAKIQAINMQDKTSLGQFINQLQESLSSLPVIHLILAVEPNNQLINIIHDWFYQTYKKLVLLDISYDKSLIAGAVISFNGKANEYSLRNKIAQMI